VSAAASRRLPLQTGTTALWSIARGAVGLLVGPALVAGLATTSRDDLALWMYLAAVIGVAAFSYGAWSIVLAIAARPSDITIAADGLRIDGGPLDGSFFEWVEVDAQASKLTPVHVYFSRVEVRDVAPARATQWELELGLRSGGTALLATEKSKAEHASLQLLLEALVAASRPHDDEAPRPVGIIEVLRCASCGGLAKPSAEPTVPCQYCGATIAVPSELAARVLATREARGAKRKTEQLVQTLLERGEVSRARVALAVVGIASVVAVALAFVVALYMGATGRLTPRAMALLACSACTFVAGVAAGARVAFTDRMAMRLIALDFGAHAPKSEGEPYRCRVCTAPLDETDGALSVCVYCSAENVLGVDCRRNAHDLATAANALADVLAARNTERRRWRVLSGVGGIVGTSMTIALALALAAPR
jgi:DNA-directed RNA polymerase subunit RPC12/RpoP